MPGATLPNISIILPALGGDSGTWDDELNAALTLLDGHDHSAGKGLRIKTAAIQIDAALSFGGFAITAAGQVAFTAVAALAAGSKILFVNTADNELYWRTNGGTNVKLTLGASINTSLVGGFVGDYAAVGAQAAFDDANDQYTFKQQGTFPWAKVAIGGLKLLEFNTLTTNAISLLCPAALAASYTLTLPGALPGAAAFWQQSAAGTITFSNTIAAVITAQEFKHSVALALQMPAITFFDFSAAFVKNAGGTSGAIAYWQSGAGAAKLVAPITLPFGSKITGYTIFINKATNAGVTLTGRIYSMKSQGGTSTVETAEGAGSSNSQNAPGTAAAQLTESSLNITITAASQYYIVFTNSAGAGGDLQFGCEIDYTRP
jgi:hypothetical protein